MDFHSPYRHFLRARRDRQRRGATAVEMALIAPVFFLLLMGITEITLIETGQALLENAAYNTSRLAKTGYTALGESQVQTVTQILTTELSSLGSLINTANVTVTESAYNSFGSIGQAGQGTAGLGNPEQIVVYTITYPWKLLTPLIGRVVGQQDASGNWIVNLTSRIVVRNEPY